jgi:pimeloyl-ACP methyl ester carboxylesterase
VARLSRSTTEGAYLGTARVCCGYRRTAMLVGHDLGSPVAAYCALVRPDVFPSVVLMSAPFPGPPALPFNTAESEASSVQPNTENQKLAAALAALDPPREYYQQYLSTQEANYDMWHPPQGFGSARSCSPSSRR